MIKQKKCLILIIIFSIIILTLTIFSINYIKTSKKIIICKKELTMLDTTYENRYIIRTNNKDKITNIKIENKYNNITDSQKEKIKNELNVGSGKPNSFTCADEKEFVCIQEIDKIYNSEGVVQELSYVNYLNMLKQQGYVCK